MSRILLLVLACAGWFACPGADLPYQRQATRDQTRQAMLSAITRQLKLPELSQSDWQLIGPFDNPQNGGLDIKYPPESKYDPAAAYPGPEQTAIRWQEAGRFTDGKIHDLKFPGRKDWILSYLHRTIVAPQDVPATLLVGSDDSITIWVNGTKVHDHRTSRPTSLDSDVVPIQLRSGTNTVLMKVGQFQGNYSFAYRLSAIPQEWLTKLEDRLNDDFPTGESVYYRIRSIEIPEQINLEVGGLAFNPDGTLMICTRRGEIWSYHPEKAQWRLFATGLHEPLGICVLGPGEIAVAQRPELTRVKDTDGDGIADLFETMTAEFGISGNYHEYHYGPVRDKAGNFYGTLNLAWEGISTSPVAVRGSAYELTPQGRFSVWALGLRSPAGIGLSPSGDLFVTDNQGDWWGTSPLLHLRLGGFYGHPASTRWVPGYNGPPNPHDTPPENIAHLRKLPAAWFVINKLGRSPGEPVWDTNGGKFGPFAGQMLIGDQTKSMMIRAALERIGDEYQGALFPFRNGFASGITRMVFDTNATLWVGGTDRGWGSVGGKPFALQTVTWTGKVPFEIHTMKLGKAGFELTFTKPADPAAAANPANYSFTRFHYNYWRKYGSDEIDTEPVKVLEAVSSADGRSVAVRLETLTPGKVYELHVKGIKATDGSELQHPEAYYTLNKLLQ